MSLGLTGTVRVSLGLAETVNVLIVDWRRQFTCPFGLHETVHMSLGLTGTVHVSRFSAYLNFLSKYVLHVG